MTRAFIEGKVDDFHYRVRIPVLNKLDSSVGATPTKELAIATIATPPGISPKFKNGDLVFIEYEEQDTSKPVIVGRMFNTLTSSIVSDAQFDSVQVSVNAHLPNDSTVGNNNSQNLKYLNGLTTNVQTNLDTLNVDSKNNKDSIRNLNVCVIEVQNIVIQLQEEIEVIKTTIKQIQSDIVDIKNDITTIQNNISDIQNDIVEINNNIDSINEKNTQQDTQINNLDNRLDNVENQLNGNSQFTGKIRLNDASFGTTAPSGRGSEGQIYLYIQ